MSSEPTMDLSRMVKPRCSSRLRMKMRRTFLSRRRSWKSLRAWTTTARWWEGTWEGEGRRVDDDRKMMKAALLLAHGS